MKIDVHLSLEKNTEYNGETWEVWILCLLSFTYIYFWVFKTGFLWIMLHCKWCSDLTVRIIVAANYLFYPAKSLLLMG